MNEIIAHSEAFSTQTNLKFVRWVSADQCSDKSENLSAGCPPTSAVRWVSADQWGVRRPVPVAHQCLKICLLGVRRPVARHSNRGT
jgi:hypothetical protein